MLDPIALVTVAEAKAFLTVAGDASNGDIEAAISAATVSIEEYCNRAFRERTITAERVEGPRTERLWLRAQPLKATGTVTVTVNEIAQTVWKQESDGLQSAFDVIARADHLYRRIGWQASGDPFNVLLTYTGGYVATAVPQPVKHACLYLTQKLYRDAKRQLAEITQVNTPQGGITILDTTMPRMARMLLDPYRLRIAA